MLFCHNYVNSTCDASIGDLRLVLPAATSKKDRILTIKEGLELYILGNVSDQS